MGYVRIITNRKVSSFYNSFIGFNRQCGCTKKNNNNKFPPNFLIWVLCKTSKKKRVFFIPFLIGLNWQFGGVLYPDCVGAQSLSVGIVAIQTMIKRRVFHQIILKYSGDSSGLTCWLHWHSSNWWVLFGAGDWIVFGLKFINWQQLGASSTVS